MKIPVPIPEAPTPHPLAAGIRLCCFDVDGTIMNSTHQISTPTRAAFEFLRTQHIQIGLATGRPLFGVQQLLETLPITAPCSLFGGALLYDPVQRQSILETFLDPHTVESLISFSRKQHLYLELYTARSFATENSQSPYPAIHAEYLRRQPDIISDFASLSNQTVFKAVVVVPVAAQLKVVSQLEAHVPGCVAACSPGAAHPEIMFINITAARNSRAHTFAALLNYLDISADAVLSFGDGESDREFLSAAGIGVAMQGGNQSVLAAANYVTASVDEEGVHRAIARLFAADI